MTIRKYPYAAGSVVSRIAGGGGGPGNGNGGGNGGPNGGGGGGGGNNGNNGGGGGGGNPNKATASAILLAMLHYWNFTEADTNAVSTNRVDSKAVGTAWTLAEDVANLATTATGVRGGGSVAARIVDGGSSGSMGGLAHARTANLTATQDWTIAGWFQPTVVAAFPRTILRESLTSIDPSQMNFWLAYDNGGAAGSPYQLFCTARGANGSDYGNYAAQEVVVDGVWYFIQVRRTHSLNRISLRVNNGAWADSTAVNTNDISNAARQISVGYTPNAGNRIDRSTGNYNYWGYYGSALTDAQLSYLYNSGQGRTYAEIVAAAA